MKFQIKYKLFFTLLLTSMVISSGMFLFMQWSFDRGFLNYVNSQEMQEMDQLAESLVENYAQHGNWNFLQGNHERWEQLLRAVAKQVEPLQSRALNRDNKPDGPPPPRGPIIALYDAQQRSIFGPPAAELHLKLQPLHLQQSVIGYLALVPVKDIYDAGDLLFVEQQTESFAVVALAMALLSLLISYPLTIHLLRPIKELTSGTRKLIAGQFKTRIPVTTKDELAQLSRDFNSLAMTLEKNEEARQQWVADISHELRTPLAILISDIEALQDGIRPSNQQNLATLHDEAGHLGRLVNDLYELSMSDIGALNYKKISVNPIGILRGTIELFEQRFAQKGLQLTSELAPDIQCSLQADPDRLQQLFGNLLENSLRYTDAPGRLHITLEHTKDLLLLRFQDSAPGVEQTQLTKLFERLYRVEKSRNRANAGAGLGLAICNNIVAAHDGKITASSSSLGGLEIQIEFPLRN
ncbi:MAG: ATP-binding protein [Desulfuromonas sp.]|nr:ATP-binding protein [Desulfuromonas sp.]